jgi:hypothetical protein
MNRVRSAKKVGERGGGLTENSRLRIPRPGAEKLTVAKDANIGQLNAVLKSSHRGHVFLDAKDSTL